MYGSPTREEIFEVAKAAVVIFSRHNLPCCLTGGAACALRGNDRSPNDVDLLVMTSIAQETLKSMLVNDSCSFYIVAPKTLGATYRVLYFRLSGIRRSCKVDILTPGVMDIPPVPTKRIRMIHGMPVMPFSGILFLKLQAWEDHRNDHREFMRLKQHMDASDIENLLKIAVRRRLRPAQDNWMPEAFITRAKARCKLFVKVYGKQEEWVTLGVFEDHTTATVKPSGEINQLVARMDALKLSSRR